MKEANTLANGKSLSAKCIKACLLIFLFSLVFLSTAFAAEQTVRLGETGVTLRVNQEYEVITKKNVKDYSSDLRETITNNNTIAVYSPSKGYFLVLFDSGKDLKRYDMSIMKKEEILQKFKSDFNEQFPQLNMNEVVIDVYESGSSKWISVNAVKAPLLFYSTNQDGRSVTVVSTSRYITQREIEEIIDSVQFGSVSFFTTIKNIAHSITEFGYSILGRIGAYMVWTLVLGLLLGIISAIGSLFKKRR